MKNDLVQFKIMVEYEPYHVMWSRQWNYLNMSACALCRVKYVGFFTNVSDYILFPYTYIAHQPRRIDWQPGLIYDNPWQRNDLHSSLSWMHCRWYPVTQSWYINNTLTCMCSTQSTYFTDCHHRSSAWVTKNEQHLPDCSIYLYWTTQKHDINIERGSLVRIRTLWGTLWS